MSLGGASGYTNFAQPSDAGLLGQPLPQFTGDDPYSQIMALMPGFRNPYANASSGNALGGFDPSIYARNYSSTDAVNGGGGGGGAGPIMGGASVGNVMPGIIDPYDQAGQDAVNKIEREIVDTDDELGYLTGNTPEPMPTPVNDDELGYITGADDELGYLTGNSPEVMPAPMPAPMPEDQYPYPSEPMQEPMVMPYEPAAYNYDQPAPAPMVMPYEPAAYNYDQPAPAPMVMPYEPAAYNYDQPAPAPMVMPYEPAAYNYDQPAPAPMAMQEPMAMPYEPVSYNYDQPAEPAGGDFRGEMGGGDFGGGLEDTGEDSFDSAGYAKGGMVHGLLGPNPKGPDDGAGFLDRGEYVIRKSAVKKYGRGLLDMINEGKVPAKKIKSLLD
jgi:hypothetical protein